MSAKETSCPVCGYPSLAAPPRTENGASYEICPSCGFEFGVSDDDLGVTDRQWREEWIVRGTPWSGSGTAPEGWDPTTQLRRVT